MDDNALEQTTPQHFDPFSDAAADPGPQPPAAPPAEIKRDRLGRRLDTRPAKRGPYKPPEKDARSKIDLGHAVQLRLKNKLSITEIAQHFNVSPSAVTQRLAPLRALLKNPDADTAYAENRAGFMDAIERKLATQILKGDKLKDASVNNIAYSMRQIHEIGRLERGQSTANVAVMTGLSETDRNWLSGMAEQLMGRMIAQDSEG